MIRSYVELDVNCEIKLRRGEIRIYKQQKKKGGKELFNYLSSILFIYLFFYFFFTFFHSHLNMTIMRLVLQGRLALKGTTHRPLIQRCFFHLESEQTSLLDNTKIADPRTVSSIVPKTAWNIYTYINWAIRL
jgi:hypothetical protein